MEVAFSQNPVYTLMAVGGSALYLIKIILLLFSGDSDGNITDDITDEIDHIDGSESFVFVSVQSVLAFFMGAGWIGLAAIHEWKLNDWYALGASVLFGFLMMLFSSFLTFKIKKLNSIPKVNLNSAIGKMATAYTNIPAKGEGIGQVKIILDGKQQILQAMSTSEKIDSFTGVLVEGIDDSGNLLVKKS